MREGGGMGSGGKAGVEGFGPVAKKKRVETCRTGRSGKGRGGHTVDGVVRVVLTRRSWCVWPVPGGGQRRQRRRCQVHHAQR